MTLLDFPGKVACTVFTPGCNLRCPFCHNALLVTDTDSLEDYGEENVLEYLKKRRGILDGVAVTGGEPLLQKDLGSFLSRVKALGFLVKLDHNGTKPAFLKELVRDGLVDYVAVDIKNCREKYAETAGTDVDLASVGETVSYLLSGEVPYEFRTTVVSEFHTAGDIRKIAEWIAGADAYYLQNFVDSGRLIGENLHPVSRETLGAMQAEAARYVKTVGIRGV